MRRRRRLSPARGNPRPAAYPPRTTLEAQADPRPRAAARAARASSRRCDLYPSLPEARSERLGEGNRAGLVAVDAQRVGGNRHALAREAGDETLLDHRQGLLPCLVRVLDHAAGLVAARDRAVAREPSNG